MGVPFIIALGAGYGLHFFSLSGLYGVLIKGSLIILIYVLIMWRLSLYKEEKTLFISPFLQIIKNKKNET